MYYQEVQPKPPFDQFIQCYWELSINTSEVLPYERIIPDGQIEVIFHFGDPYLCRVNQKEVTQPRSLIFGQLGRYLELKPSQYSGVFGIRFKTWGSNVFFPFSLTEVKNRFLDYTDLCKENLELEERICQSFSLAGRIEVWESFYLKRLISNSVDERIRNACKSLVNTVRPRMKDLASELNLSVKQLNRKFRSEVGLTPKELVKISRIKESIRLIQQNRQSLTNIALQLGYFDQSHFIKDFQHITGCSPRQYRSTTAVLNDLFDG